MCWRKVFFFGKPIYDGDRLKLFSRCTATTAKQQQQQQQQQQQDLQSNRSERTGTSPRQRTEGRWRLPLNVQQLSIMS